MRTTLLTAAGLIAVAAPDILAKAGASKSGGTQHDASGSKDAPALLPGFEVSTVKPNKEGGMFMRRFTPDGVSIKNIPIQVLLRDAFEVEDDRILGAPTWVNTKRFDIEARVTEVDVPKLDKLTVRQRGLMLRSLLKDRFNLKFHQESRALPVYALVIAKGGSKMKQSTSDNPMANGLRLMGAGHLESKGVAIEFLAQLLSRQLGRTILEETGLTGKYDYTLEWLPDAASPMAGVGEGGQQENRNVPPPNSSGSSLFTALQEQLGLRLESKKGPVSVIVIDHIEEPSPN
jgi:uncharacterized protein (TIGR03435 family)